MKSLGLVLILIGFSNFAFASLSVVAPEISPASGTAALALLSGAILVIRARRKR
jgi:hypothetical protein